MDKSSGKGYGKTILFGEHFVVYGLPGIASGIDKYVQVEVEPIEEDDVVIDDKKFNSVNKKSENPDFINFKLLEAMFSDLELNKIKITISGTSVPQAGMGYSAVLSVALARALGQYFNKDWNDEKINELAYKGEQFAHGTPSGIDNTCATYGSLVWFEKNLEGGPNTVDPFELSKPLYIVLGDTKKVGPTKELVAAVRGRKEAEPEKYEDIFKQAKDLVFEAKDALTSGDIEKVGTLMDKNHSLLKEIGVSTDELEELVKTAKDNEALGAKLTGAGGGGLMFALCKDAEHQEKVAKAFEEKGYPAFKTVIGGN